MPKRNVLTFVLGEHESAHRLLRFDDLYRSGSTMDEITGVLYDIDQSAGVRVLTITCTRTNR